MTAQSARPDAAPPQDAVREAELVAGAQSGHSNSVSAATRTLGITETFVDEENERQPNGLRPNPDHRPRDIALLESVLQHVPATTLAIESLLTDGSPRLGSVNTEHVRLLADSGDGLPPIVVHQDTMRVIDGHHRLAAVRLRGDHVIIAKLFSGSDREAFLLSVWLNTRHGLPLTLSDRRAATARILEQRSQMSDRAIARAVGLSPTTVAKIRRETLTQPSEREYRVGLDGRVRPVNREAKKQAAEAYLRDHPTATVREVANFAQVSTSTVQALRQRLETRDGPLAETRPAKKARQITDDSLVNENTIRLLAQDPSIRSTEAGRMVVTWLRLSASLAQNRTEVAGKLPPHCSEQIAAAFHSCLTGLEEFLQELNHALVAGSVGSSPH